MYRYLKFFNKKGEYFNFDYNSTIDRWIGRVDFGSISTGIAEDFQIYLMEEIFNTNLQQYEMSYPHSIDANTSIIAYFNKLKKVDELFIYDFVINETQNTLNKYYSYEYNLLYDSGKTFAGNNAVLPGIKETDVISTTALQINLGFFPEEEDEYKSILYLKDANEHIFAEILLYGEGEEEDERLRDLLQSFGADLLAEDSIIFDTSDVNETDVDWKLINIKRKELILEHSNIFPFLGSYKALINIIKFFGYQNLRMKEYWLNVDQQSANFGKYKQIEISDVFNENAKFSNTSLIPSKIYKKTNKFGLFYDITTDSGLFDENGIPIVKEVFTFTPQEILIKIYALKRKLQNYYLPVNAKIIDIIGESVFYGQYNINSWSDQHRIDNISVGLVPKYSVFPDKEGFISDIRPIIHSGCPIGKDLKIGGFSNLLSWRIGINSTVDTSDYLDSVQIFTLIVDIPFGESITLDTVFKTDLNSGKYFYSQEEIAEKIEINWKSNKKLNDKFYIYREHDNSRILRIVQKTPDGDGQITSLWTSNTSSFPSYDKFFIPGPTAIIGPAGSTASSIDVSPGGSFGPSGAPISYFSDCFFGYFDNINLSIENLNDDENAPVGYAAVLRNETFDITWDEAKVVYNQVDQVNSNTNFLLYANFNFSSESNFPDPLTDYIPPPLYNWNTLGYYGYYEMQWIIRKDETDTPAFFLDSGRESISLLSSFPIILPYEGFYTVELYLWDGWNTKSYIIDIDAIKVNVPELDYIGWYQLLEADYLINTKRYEVQVDIANRPKLNANLTWDQYASTWNLPFHPNEELMMTSLSFNALDSIEFYQSIKNPIDNPLVDRYPYKWNLITDLITWEDAYHLWWDGIGTKITQWEIRDITGPTVNLFMTQGNSIVNLESSIDVIYENGPIDFEGANASYPTGSTGDCIVSNANGKVFQWNGNQWVFINQFIDSIEIDSLTHGTLKENMIELCKQLNERVYSENHPYFSNFIYYFNEEYGSNYELNPYIRAVSKSFDKHQRHKIKGINVEYDNKSYETVYFGYLGDIPTHFEIYSIDGPSASILLPGMNSAYEIGSTNLTDLEIELNGTAQSYKGISDYEFNLVLGYSGWSGPAGPSINEQTVTKLQGIAKKFTSPEEIDISFNDIAGTVKGRSLIKNPDWNQLRVLKYSQQLPLCSVVNFTYDDSKMRGKTSPKWILKKEDDSSFDDIYYENQYFSYMFTERGSYSLSLDVRDTNGNKKQITKKEIIKII